MMLPKDICIESLNLVSENYHARFDAASRTYEYFINLSVSVSTLIFPLHRDISIIPYLHNELLQIISVVGLVGVFMHYMVTYNRIKIIFKSNIGAAISIAMVIIIGGILVLPTIHPYTGILIAYLISYYSKMELIPIKDNSI